MEGRKTNGLKGQQAYSSGQRPECHGTGVKNALKGHKQIWSKLLLPLQGVPTERIRLPRALP